MGRMTEVVALIAVTVTADDIGNQVETPTERQVFGEKVAVYGATYYNAALAGLRPSLMLDVWRREYADEAKLRHEGITYRVIRTEDMGEKLRLTCERVGADG